MRLNRSTAIAFILGLLLASAGTATAAKLITGKQIKNGSITLADLSPKTQAALKGTAPWETIPSGVTVTGIQTFDTEAPAPNGDYRLTIYLPGLAPAPLTDAMANFGPDATPATSEEDTTCTGSRTNPTAPPGKFCAYTSSTQTAGVQEVSIGSLESRNSVSLRLLGGTAGDRYVTFSWAYTAP